MVLKRPDPTGPTPDVRPGGIHPGGVHVRKKLTSKQRWEARKLKRRQVEQCYREHTPPQVRHLRWLKRVGQA